MIEINREFASKVLETVNAGLVSGLGAPKPGAMCVEAAICYAMDLPHSDSPICVGSAVRSFMIRLNDAKWPTDADRTAGLRKLSIAQLGSNTINQHAFRKIIILETVRNIIPIALRAAGKMNPKFTNELELKARNCEACSDYESSRAVAITARDLARKVRAAAYAADAADAAAYAAAYAYAADAAAAAAYAAAYADAIAADAYTYATYAAAAYAAYAYADAARLEVLKTAAQIGLDALIELKSPGVAFLDLVQP